jgi:hypothetical protein
MVCPVIVGLIIGTGLIFTYSLIGLQDSSTFIFDYRSLVIFAIRPLSILPIRGYLKRE